MDLLFNYEHEYLKHYYKIKDSLVKLPLFSDFYKVYLLFFCIPTFTELRLNELIEEMVEKKAKEFYQENYQEEDQKEKKQQKKHSRYESNNNINDYKKNNINYNLNNFNIKHIKINSNDDDNIKKIEKENKKYFKRNSYFMPNFFEKELEIEKNLRKAHDNKKEEMINILILTIQKKIILIF